MYKYFFDTAWNSQRIARMLRKHLIGKECEESVAQIRETERSRTELDAPEDCDTDCCHSDLTNDGSDGK